MPARGYLWNLAHWITRLGFERSDVPDIAYGVQPVLITGDASDLTTPLLTRMAIIGGQFTAAAGETSMFTWRTHAAGGCFISSVLPSSNGNEEFQYAISVAPVTFSASLNLPPVNMGPTPVQGVATLGSTTSALNDNRPTTKGSNISLFPGGHDRLYIPPGSELRVQMEDLATLMRFLAIVKDVPVAVPAP